jgi:transposase
MLDFQTILDLPNVKVLNSTLLDDGAVLIEVESTDPQAVCRLCKAPIDKFHDHADSVRIRHLDILGRRCFLQLRPKRFSCPRCKSGKGSTITTQSLPWYRSGSRYTKAFENFALLMLVNSTVSDVAIKIGLGREVLFGLIERHIKSEVNWEDYDCLTLIGLDEIALRKGHGHFVTLVTTIVDGQVEVLAVLKNREKETVAEFLASIPERLRSTIKEACVDMYKGFANAVKKVLPHVMVTADRFHVAKAYREGADNLRKKELKRLKEELPKEEYKEVKGAMWSFRSDEKLEDMDANAEGTKALKRLLELCPKLRLARELRLELTEIFDRGQSKAGGKIALGRWRAKVERSELKCFDSFLKTLKNWWEAITNYFVNFNTSGFVEGLNNKVKALKRRCYGLADPTSLFRRIRLDIGGYKSFKPSYST